MVYLIPVISDTYNDDNNIIQIGWCMTNKQMIDEFYITSEIGFIDDFMKSIVQKLGPYENLNRIINSDTKFYENMLLDIATVLDKHSISLCVLRSNINEFKDDYAKNWADDLKSRNRKYVGNMAIFIKVHRVCTINQILLSICANDTIYKCITLVIKPCSSNEIPDIEFHPNVYDKISKLTKENIKFIECEEADLNNTGSFKSTYDGRTLHTNNATVENLCHDIAIMLSENDKNT